MQSRMDRYKNNRVSDRRSNKNEDLYRSIYNNSYSNIEGVAKMEKTNEIDITKIQEMLKSRENYKKQAEYDKIFNKEPEKPIIDRLKEIEDEQVGDDKNYDIRDILVKAKEEKKDDIKNDYHDLKNTQYNILKNINLKEEILKKDDEISNLLNELKESNNLSSLDDGELSLNLLNDLKDNGGTLSNTTASPSIKEILTQAKQDEKANNNEDTDELDKSFFTSSFNFSDKDFEDLKEINKSIKKHNTLIKVLSIIVILAVLAGAGFFVYTLLK
jgi:hypothetical protein